MEYKNIKTAAIVLAFILFVIGFINTFRLQVSIDDLKSQLSNMENNLIWRTENRIASLEGQLQQQKLEIQDMLEAQQSLFDETQVNISFQDDNLHVTIMAIPKLLTADEHLIARINADDRYYETIFDDGKATFTIGLAEYIQPTLIIESSSAVKQESLPAINTADLLMVDIYSEWHHDLPHAGETSQDETVKQTDKKLDLWLFHRPMSSLSGINDGFNSEIEFETKENGFLSETSLKNAEFIIIERGDLYDDQRGTAIREVAESWPHQNNLRDILLGNNNHATVNRIPAQLINDQSSDNFDSDDIYYDSKYDSKYTVGYQVDVSNFADRGENTYFEIYFVLTMKNEIQLVSLTNPVGTFSFSEGGSNASSGSDRLTLVFP